MPADIYSVERPVQLPHHLHSSHWEAGVSKLLDVLNPWLMAEYETCLIAAESEPFYAPKSEAFAFHQIQFAHGYFNSALHELAHWCVAGKERRLLPDFGYWYEPDGRTAEQQKAFEQVEVKPQALEWHFTLAAGRDFRVSVDNLSGEPTDSAPFKRAVAEKALDYQNAGLPERAASVVNLLASSFGTNPTKFNFA